MGKIKQILYSLQNNFLEKLQSRTRAPRSAPTPNPLPQGRGRSLSISHSKRRQ